MGPHSPPLGRLAALCLALTLAGCDATVVSQPPGTTAPGSPGPGSSANPGEPGSSVRPGSSPGTAPGSGKPAPLPRATITEPGDIGLALYNPGQVGDAVVSLLQLLGIGIYDADGNVIRAGNERVEGDPWLLDSEVRGLIDMGVEDLLAYPDGNLPYSLADLYQPLATALPGLTLDQFIAAYRDSYAERPDDVAPAAMLGMPLDESARLTRTQLWLLYMDGFVELANAATARPANGTQTALSSGRFGTANAVLPLLLQPNGMAAADWVEIRAHLPTIAYSIDFQVSIANAHEGHGGLGRDVAFGASVSTGRPFRSAIPPHRILLQPNPASRAGLDIEWGTRSQAVIDRHGSVDISLPSHATTDASGQTYVLFTPKQELADGQGFVANELANVYAKASLADLIRTAYLVDDTTFARMLALGTLGGTRTANGGIDIEWHAPGIEVLLINDYEVTVDLTGAMGPVIATAYRKGVDSASGVLFKADDGNFYGTFEATSQTLRSSYIFNGTLAGEGKCADDAEQVSQQELYVVGTPIQRQHGTADFLVANSDGTIGDWSNNGILLRFFPIEAPTGDFGCQKPIPYDWYGSTGFTPRNVAIAGSYIPLNDTRWSIPSMGYTINLPPNGELTYDDDAQAQYMTSIPNIDSTWQVNVVLETPPP